MQEERSPLEFYAIAIRSEIAAKDIYARASARIGNARLKEKLDFLQAEETKHRNLLEENYRERFPDIPLELPDQSLLPGPRADVSEASSVLELFEIAMQWEQDAGGFYEEFSRKASDPGSRSMLLSLAAAEWGHYHLLKSELDLLKAYPSYASTKDFNPGEDFLHIGP